ncbi:MAG TPA: hypothetical protein VKE71_14185, partial [Candidatus Angelobacter sp.]|nr:hypothetical protein [Candidatus Angelobacter sp.]
MHTRRDFNQPRRHKHRNIGDQLTGKESENSPALTGKTFEDQWNGRTVGDLFRKILRKMPQDDPGRLTPQESADLVAFLLRFNKF